MVKVETLPNTVYYFDMDGVLCDWEDQYNKVGPDVPLSEFSELTKDERTAIKETFINYSFFRTMRPLAAGMVTLRELVAKVGVENVCILSATGTVNKDEVIKGKRDWCSEYLDDKIRVMLVDKVENKPEKMLPGYDVQVLIDDRRRALDAWTKAGGVGVLFV